jgi:hypothetical protein
MLIPYSVPVSPPLIGAILTPASKGSRMEGRLHFGGSMKAGSPATIHLDLHRTCAALLTLAQLLGSHGSPSSPVMESLWCWQSLPTGTRDMTSAARHALLPLS